jgi:GNAT superfamily N-acetyltransferase
MSLKLRVAVKADMESVLILIKELATFEKEPEAVEVTVDELIKDGFGESPAFKVFVAELDNKIVGMALFYQRYSTWKGKSIHLEDLVVQEDHRGKGIGNALYTKVLKYAYVHNFKRVVWDVLDWNTVAIDFYKSTGASILKEWQVVHMNEIALKKFVESNG